MHIHFNVLIREKNITKIFHAAALLLFASLFAVSLFITGNNSYELSDEYIYLEANSPLPTVAAILGFAALMFALGKLYDKLLCRCPRNLLLGIVCLISLSLSLYWVSGSGTAPQADQEQICHYAERFNEGDFEGLSQGCYMARYRQQLGMVTLLRGFFLLFGAGNYQSYQYFLALLVPVIILSGCQILRRISGNNGRAEWFFLSLSLTCFPMYAYTAFVYGDLASTAFALLAAWCFLSCLERFSLPGAAALAFCVGTALQLRQNTIIIFIAFWITAAVKLLQKRDFRILAAGCSVLAGALLSQALINGLYRNVGDENADSIPATLHIAMGMHDRDGRPGWYDGYVQDAFTASGEDGALAREMGRRDIRDSLARFRENPVYMFHFYARKINSQWQAPMYQCIAMNSLITKEQSPLIGMIFTRSPLHRCIRLYMKAFQVFLYGCVLLWLALHRKKGLPVESCTLLIAVFGGFLFSILWETKTRYVMPYMLLLLPYFAMGMQDLIHGMEHLLPHRKENKP